MAGAGTKPNTRPGAEPGTRPSESGGAGAGQAGDRRRGWLHARGARGAGLVAMGVLLAAGCVLSLRIGSAPLSTGTVFSALFDFDGSYDQAIVRERRLPRTVIGLAVGAALAVSGVIMQAVTRNPLAGPGILGVNAGAAFAVVTAIHLLGATTPGAYVWFAFAGALAATALVFLVGSAGAAGASTVKLALAGVVVTALLGSWTSAVLVLNQQTLNEARFWLAGGIADRELATLGVIGPFLAGGLILGLATMRQLNALSLGDDVARALGQRTTLIRVTCTLLVVVLAGAAVAIAGPIGFVGLAVPHIARLLTGPNHRWLLCYAVLLGPLALLSADIAGRVVARPAELPAGIVTAVVGAPFLIYLARRRKSATV